MIRTLALGAFVALSVLPAAAAGIKAGSLTIDDAWARATPKGAAVGAGYLTIHNNGAEPDKLTGGTAAFAAVQVHEMSMTGGVMKMRALPDGLTIPPHGAVTLAPGGYHLMFVGLKAPFVKGQPVKAMLNFERAGPVEVTFDVQDVGAAAPKADGKKM